MAKQTHSPNQAEYEKLCQAKKDTMALVMVVTHEAEWHIVDMPPKTDVNIWLTEHEREWQIVFNGWESFLRYHSRKSLETIHKHVWPDYKIGKNLATNEALSVLIWNYRLSRAIDRRKAVLAAAEKPIGIVKNPMQRASAIAGRTYTIIPQASRPIDAKPFTSPAGITCYNLIVECCGESGSCSEGDLKLLVEEKGSLITKSDKPNAPWRFLQFYRPLLVESQWIAYQK